MTGSYYVWYFSLHTARPRAKSQISYPTIIMGKSAKKKRLRDESTSAGDNGNVDDMISSSSTLANASGGGSSAPSTPIKGAGSNLPPNQHDDDDPLLWSKSKRKRMRQKAKKLSMTTAGDNGVLGDPRFPSSGQAKFDDEVDDGNINNGNNKKRERNAEYDGNNDNNDADDNTKNSASISDKKKKKKRMDSNSNNISSIMVQLPKIQPSNEKVDIDGDNDISSPKKKRKKNKKKKSNATAATNNDYSPTNTGADDNKRHDEYNYEDVWQATTATPGGDKDCNNAHQTSASSITDNVNGRSCIPKRKKDKKNKDDYNDEKKASSLSSPSSPRRGASPLSIGMDGEIILSPQPNHNHKSSMSNNSQSTIQISIPKTSQMSTLQRDFLDRLTSSRFRELNEELYTQCSSTSYETFTKSPELFDQYHVGFRKQVQSWPVNPVDVIYKKIINGWTKDRQRQRQQQQQQQQQSNNDYHNNNKTKQRNGDSSAKIVVADFGCGDAKLADRLLSLQVGGKDGNSLEQQSSSTKKKKNSSMMMTSSSSLCPFVVHSFDLVSGGNPRVTPADMSNVPLANEIVDVAVYSLALMGTNVADFVREAWRVLKFNGVLRVAEVRSRFETAATTASGGGGSSPNKYDKSMKRGKLDNGGMRQHYKFSNAKMNNNANDDSPKPLMLLDEFISLLERCGFQCTNMDQSNKMFLFLDFVKQDGSLGLSDKERFTAKACIYKKR